MQSPIFLCRLCGTPNPVQILDLGLTPPSNALLSTHEECVREKSYPLELLFCDECKLLQTKDFHQDNELFNEFYPYLSSTSKTWIKHCNDLVKDLFDRFELTNESLVAEIASNDGYLLNILQNRRILNYGIEPTPVPAKISKDLGHHVYELFLNSSSVETILKEQPLADIVIANNVFAHVPQLLDFTKAVRRLIKANGVLVLEIQYVLPLLRYSLFDTVYHEHYSYFSLTSLNYLLELAELYIFDFELILTHGGSLRVFASPSKRRWEGVKTLAEAMESEKEFLNIRFLGTLQSKVEDKVLAIQSFLSSEDRKLPVIGYGAAAKGNTFLNVARLDNSVVKFVIDNASSKVGKLLPGSHIPIVPGGALESLQGGTIIVLPWNLSNEIVSSIRSQFQDRFEIVRFFPEIEVC